MTSERIKRCKPLNDPKIKQPQSQPEVKCSPILGVGPELKHRDIPDTPINI